MKTHYFCKRCNEFFTEEGMMPNINKVHSCGTVARVVQHEKIRKAARK